MSARQFSLVTNASAHDLDRLRLVIPHWIRVFGERLGELAIVIDDRPASGRIARLHGQSDDGGFAERLARLSDAIEDMRRQDERIVARSIPRGFARRELIEKWFGAPDLDIDRCQAGTPILAFVAALETGRFPFVVRADCDMLVHEAGWLGAGFDLLEKDAADLIEPARCGRSTADDPFVSTRLFMIAKAAWAARVLPIEAARLDPVRRLHRRLRGRPPWLALEQMLDRERRNGRIRHRMLPPELGCTLHVAQREQAASPVMPFVAAAMERGRIPAEQIVDGNDFHPQAWAWERRAIG